jgi:hypothetical protein
MAEVHPTSTPVSPSTGGSLHLLPPAPPAPPSHQESSRQQLWTVQETLHLLYLLSLARNDDPIIAPEQWSSCLHLLSTQLEEALQEIAEDPVAA